MSDALISCYSQLYNLCIGYANAYAALGEYEKMAEIALWMLSLGKGLRDADTVNWMDRGDVRLYAILAEANCLRGNDREASEYLAKAVESAQRFDAAPEYRTGAGMRFFHGGKQTACYDDMGQTAMEVIENILKEGETGQGLRALWQQLKEELSDFGAPSTNGC